MNNYITTTQSLCRQCRRLIPARVCVRDDSIWLEKICPEHGFQEAHIYGDAKAYLELCHFHRKASVPLSFATPAKGCPESCGICPEHEQHICLPIIEITDHCNLQCPICLVSNPGHRQLERLDVARILDRLIESEEQIDLLNISGGEPTMNPHFRKIIEECVSRKEILRVSISTNGTILVQNHDLLQFLADRNVIISLQFDGLNDVIYQKLRGRPLLEEKFRLIDQCAALNAPMSLTVTVVQGVNETQLLPITELFFDRDHILSLMFQPAAYVGQAARLPRPNNAMTIPDVIRRLKGGGHGTVKSEDFSPLPCSHPACFSLAYYLKVADKEYASIKQWIHAERYLDLVQNRALFGTDPDSFKAITDAVYELWSGPAALSPDSDKALRAVRKLLRNFSGSGGYSPRQAMSVAERSIKSIFIHQFMDPDSFDLSRARKCCQVYPQPDGRMIPVCVNNCLKRGVE